MKVKKLIPESQYKHLPYIYKHLKVIGNKILFQQELTNGLTGKISSIQNDNAELVTFYKCISRF